MKTALTATAPKSLSIGRPPVFAIVCFVIWAAALTLAVTHPRTFEAAEGVPVIAGP